MKTEIEIRAEATEKTRSRYLGRPFEWGKVDCVKMARYQAINMGHKPVKLPRYKTLIGAVRGIKKTGFDSIDQILESMFPKIPLASARLGDLVVADGEDGIDAVFIWLGRKMMGFHEDAEGLVVVIPEQIKSAYRL